MKPFLHRHTLHLTPLSPLHLGTGEDYEPTNYVIKDGLLYAFDPSQATLTLAQRNELLQAAQSGNMQTIQKFFARHPEPFKQSAVAVSLVDNALAREYQDRLGEVAQREARGKTVLNLLRIERTATNPQTHRPYIPGSAIKGCIRTALMEILSASQAPQSGLRNGREQLAYETELLGSFATDLLRLFKPADLMPQKDILTHIQYATNHKKKRIIKEGRTVPGKGVTGRRETISHGQYRSFSGECALQQLVLDHNPAIKNPDRNLPKETRPKLQPLANFANRYNIKRFNEEAQILAERRLVNESWLASTRQLLEDLKPQLDNGQIMLLRLGKNGGAESKTLKKYAQIKIMGAKGAPPTYEEKTKTVWLAADNGNADHNLLPFGWAIIEIDPQGDNAALQKWCEENNAHLKDAAAIRAELAAQQQQRAEKAAQAERAAQEKAALEIERQAQEAAEAARIAALPYWEKNLHDWRETAKELTETKKGAGDQQTQNLIKTIAEGLQTILDDPDIDAPTRTTIAETIRNLFPKNSPLLSEKKRKEQINPLLHQLQGK